MRIAITGHTKGIGAACYLRMVSNGHEVFGFSRSNGNDVSKEQTWQSIIDTDVDVVINNAYHDSGQYNLLKYVFSKWKDKEKTIINIGSLRSDSQNSPYEKLEFTLNKRNLSDYSHWISNSKYKLRSMLFKPSWVDTDTGAVGPENCLMTPEYCAEVIEFMIDCPYTIKELSLCNMK